MADYTLGKSGSDFEDTIRRAQQAAAAQDELNRKEAERRASEEQTAGAEQRSVGVRTGLVGATDELTGSLARNIDALKLETVAINAGNVAMQRSLELRRQLAATPLSGAGRAGGGGAQWLGIQEDPQAGSRLQLAYGAQAAAEQRAKAAAAAYTGALRPGAAISGADAAVLLQQREEAVQQVAAAKQGVAAAQANVSAQEQLAAQRREALAEQQRINASLVVERQAQQQAAAAAEAAANEQAEVVAKLRLAVAAAGAQAGAGLSGDARSYLASSLNLPASGSRAAILREAGYGSGVLGTAQHPWLGTTTGGPSNAVALPEDPRAASQLENYRRVATENSAALETLTARQAAANAETNAAGAAYADASNALSRHGALTTEFISALSRGQVSLQEFGSQMTATIGKFGGWAIAGAAVFGVFKLFEDLTKGATETQAAVQQLGRFIPGLGGPAGGGKGQIPAAEAAVRDISTQFNVPISEVTSTMSVLARTFHNLNDAADATRAALAVARLDLVTPQQAEQYLPAISRSFGLTSGSQLIGVVNGLNQLQSQFGARVQETLPAIARAAPAAVAAGTSESQLAALAALGVRAGLPGTQVGTALLRSQGTFAFRPSSQLTFREYGLNPEVGNYGGLVTQIFSLIDRRARSNQPLTGPDLNRLAQGLGGNLLGSRAILPLLVQEQLHPGTFERGVESYQHPRPYQDDLGQVLGTVSERFKAIGIALQNFGSQIASAGLLSPLTGLLDVMVSLVHGFETLLGPVVGVAGLFNELPGPLRDAIGLFVAFRAARALAGTTAFGRAQSFVGRLPGLSAIQNQPREAVGDTLARFQTYLLPEAQRADESAQRRLYQAGQGRDRAYAAQADYQARAQAAGLTTLPENDPRRAEYLKTSAALEGRINESEARVNAAEQDAADQAAQYAKLQAQKVILADKSLSYAERAAFLEQQNLVATQEIIDLKEQYVTTFRASLAGVGGVAAAGVAGRGGGLSEEGAGGEAALAALTGRVVSDVSHQAGTMTDVTRGIAAAAGAATITGAAALSSSEPPPVPGESVPPPGYAPEATQAAVAQDILTRARTQAAVLGDAVSARRAALGTAVSEAGGVLPFARQTATGALTNSGAAFAGILGSQLIGNAIGGSTGQGISNVASTAFSGLLIGQLLKPGNATASLAGLGAGLLFGGQQAGGTLGGVTSAVGGGLLARAGISAATSLLPIDAVAPEVGIPLTIASAAAGFLFGSSGGNQNQPSQYDVNYKARVAANKALGLSKLGLAGNVNANLETAFLGAGGNTQQAQANIKGIVDSLTAQIQLTGSGSAIGQHALEGLNTVLGAAAGLVQSDPASASQLIQTLTQTQNQEVQRRLQYNISTGSGPHAGAAAVSGAIGQYQLIPGVLAGQAANYQQQAADAQGQLAALTTRANAATGPEKAALEKQVAAKRASLPALQQQASLLSSMADLAQQNATLQIQQAAQAGYSADIQSQQAQGQLKVSQAGGNVAGQIRAQIANYRQQLATTQSFPGLDPRTRANDVAALQSQIIDAQNKAAQQVLTEIQARGAVSEASTPVGQPVAEAAQKVKDLAAQYEYMKKNAHAFDPKDILAAYASMIAARRDLAQTASDYAIQMTGAQGQIAQAQDYGDAVAQAQDAIDTATRQLAEAVTPEQRTTAQANILAGQNQKHQAYQQRIQAEGELAASEHPGDAIAAAQAIVTSAQQALANAKGIDEQIAAQKTLNDANNQLYQAVTQAGDTFYQTLEVQSTGDTIYQAAVERARALYDLSRARGPTERAAALGELAQANVAAHQAHQQRIGERGSLTQALDQGNTVQAARAAVQSAVSVLANARGTDELFQAETALAQAEYQLTQARLQRIANLAQLRQTEETGNSVAQANTAVAAARHEQAVVRGAGPGVEAARRALREAEHRARNETDPTQKALDELGVARARRAYTSAEGNRRDEQIAARQRSAEAAVQLRQARQTRVQERGSLAEARDQDPAAQANIAVQTARKELELAHGTDAKLQAEATLANAEYQLHQARVQRIQGLAQLAEAQAFGDPLEQAQIEVQAAEKELSLAKTTAERIQAETDLANANLAYNQAVSDRATALGALSASTTRDPLTQLADQIAAARQVLANAVSEQQRITAQTNLNDLLNQYTSTATQQTEDTINFQLQMKQITAQQAIAQLQGLLSTKNLTIQEQQQIEEQIRQLQLGGGTSEFNLAPGSIKLPTVYDIAKAMGAAGAGASSPFGTGSVSATANTTVQVFVANEGDVPKVAAAIDAATGSQVAAALRAAGIGS